MNAIMAQLPPKVPSLPGLPGHLSAGTDKMINARQMPGEVGWARLKLTEPLLYFKLLQLLGLTNKENAWIGYTSSSVFIIIIIIIIILFLFFSNCTPVNL